MLFRSNAVKFTPNGGRISVTAEHVGRRIRIAIADTGIGIAPDALPRVFDRFYRVESARTREGAGSGLGLALARWIVERHHATIRVDSRPGHGSTFIVTLAACRDVRPSD